MSVGISLIGIAIGSGYVGEIPQSQRSAYALTTIFITFLNFYWAAKYRKTHHIDISGNGQIRLGEYRASTAQGAEELVWLMPDSTLWPHVLILRLKGSDEKKKVLLILRDSVSHDVFRSLIVACRWIVLRNQQKDGVDL